MPRATEGNIKKSIIKAIDKAAKEIKKLTGEHLRKSPEYILNVYIVKEICKIFQTIGFRFEMRFSDLFRVFNITPRFPKYIGEGAKFDIVLTSRRTSRPRHVIEVKRSISNRQIAKETKRIKFVAESNHGSRRLEKGFIVCVARIKERGRPAETLIENRAKIIRRIVGLRFTVTELHKMYEYGELGFAKNERLIVVVFEIKNRSNR